MAAAPWKWDITPPCLPAGWRFPFSGGAPWSPDRASPTPPPYKRQPSCAQGCCQAQGLEKSPSCFCTMQALQTLPCPGWQQRWTPSLGPSTQGWLGFPVGRGGQGHSTLRQLLATQDLGPAGRPSVSAPGRLPAPSERPAVSDVLLACPASSPVGLTWATARPLSHAAPDTLWAPLSSQRRLGLGWLPFLHGDRTPVTCCSATDSCGVQAPGFVVDVEGGGEGGASAAPSQGNSEMLWKTVSTQLRIRKCLAGRLLSLLKPCLPGSSEAVSTGEIH